MKYHEFTYKNIDSLKDFCPIPDKTLQQLKLLASVFPFKTNNYVISNLINWENLENDPVYITNFPQPSFLNEELKKLLDSCEYGNSLCEMKFSIKIRQSIISQMKPAEEIFNNELPNGLYHRFPHTLMLFPAEARFCHGICTYCFRWGIHQDRTSFSYNDPLLPVRFIKKNEEISDVLISGGDAFFMSASDLKKYIVPLLHIKSLKTIRLATKVFTWWPYRFVSDNDASDILDLIRLIGSSGKNCTIMAHISHPVELNTSIVQQAIKNVKSSGVIIRSQTPIIAHVNDSANTIKMLLNREVESGIVPYYLFLESSKGISDYFKISPPRALEIFQDAISSITGLARTVRGPVWNQNGRKVLLDGIVDCAGHNKLILKCLQSPDKTEVNSIRLIDYDANTDLSWN